MTGIQMLEKYPSYLAPLVPWPEGWQATGIDTSWLAGHGRRWLLPGMDLEFSAADEPCFYWQGRGQ